MIVAFMYCDADAGRALALARLLAEIEPGFRDGVVLLGACQPGTARTADHSATLRACEKKFTTVFLDSPRGGVGHPEGCGQLWAGTMEICGRLCHLRKTRDAIEELRKGGRSDVEKS